MLKDEPSCRLWVRFDMYLGDKGSLNCGHLSQIPGSRKKFADLQVGILVSLVYSLNPQPEENLLGNPSEDPLSGRLGLGCFFLHGSWGNVPCAHPAQCAVLKTSVCVCVYICGY